MAKRGRSRGGGGSGSGSSFGRLDQSLEELGRKAVDLAENFGGLATNAVESSTEFKRAKGALEDMVSRGIFPAAQALADSFSPGSGSIVQDIQKGLGQITASGNAGKELAEMAGSSAANGVPMTEDELREFFPMLKARQENAESARALANKVSAEDEAKSGANMATRAADAIGLTDGIMALKNELPQLIAHEVGAVLREILGGHGR